MKLSCLYICTDNHNVILNVSDRSVEKLASPDKILESVNFIKKSLIEKIDIYINNVYGSPIIDTIIEGTDCLLCLRKTQAMWGKRTGFEAVTTRSSVARTNH